MKQIGKIHGKIQFIAAKLKSILSIRETINI